MDDTLYRETILEHWRSPQNYGVITDADIDTTRSNPNCGDIIRITAIIKDGILTDIAFTAESCAIAKASASLFTERVKTLPLNTIAKLSSDDVLAELGITLTPARRHCALLAHQALNEALTGSGVS